MSATPDTYFRQQWNNSDDPWDQATRWYEQRKYRLIVAALPRPRYSLAFEPGCGAGFLTALLAERCDRIVAVEREEEAVAATRRNTSDSEGVEVRLGQLPTPWEEWLGDAQPDLVVLSEVLYYLSAEDLDVVARRAGRALSGGADLVAVHFRGDVPDHTHSGDSVHETLVAVVGTPSIRHRERDFLLDIWSHSGTETVQ